MIKRPRGFALVALLAGAACGSPANPNGHLTLAQRLPLPAALKEVSGLATAGPRRVLAVADEVATVYAIDLEAERIEVLFSLGEPPVTADFEGITVAGNDVWLTESNGTLYRAMNALEGGTTQPRYEVFKTRLKKRCEVEGLSFDSTQFLLACKENFRKAERDHLVIHAWSPGDTRARVYLSRPLEDLGVRGKLAPSGLSVQGDTLYVIAARQHVLLEIDRSGRLTGRHALPGHPQPEGIAILEDGSIVIADEGKSAAGLVSRYTGITGSD